MADQETGVTRAELAEMREGLRELLMRLSRLESRLDAIERAKAAPAQRISMPGSRDGRD